MMDCLLCAFVSGRLRAAIVYRDDDVVALMSPAPANAGHVLVTPVRHIDRLAEMSEEEGMQMFRTAMRMQRAIETSSIKSDGTFLGLVDGESAFQIVPHIYLDIVPRFRRDRYWALADIDEPYARRGALLERLFDDRVRGFFSDRRARDAESDPARIDQLAEQIRNSYAALWCA